MSRTDLTEQQWRQLEPLLPSNPRRGHAFVDRRRVLNGILWREKTGAPWRDVPPRSAPGKPAMTASCAGRAMASGSAFCGSCRPRPMPPGRSTGMALRSMLLISRRTEVRLVPGKTAPQRKKGGLERRVAGTFTGRPHEQAASLCRWPRTPIGGHRHGRSTCRRHPDRIGARCHFCSPPGTRSASKTSHSPARGPCIWGAQVASADPVPQDSVHLPGARRRQSTSLEARERRRLSAFLRSPGVQGAQRRRARHQSAHGLPGRRYPLRQARLPLPGNRDCRNNYPMDLLESVRQTLAPPLPHLSPRNIS